MTAIEKAIQSNQRYVDAIDRLMGEAARKEDLVEVQFLSQLRENAVYLLNSLKAIRHRPEVNNVPPGRMVKAALRPREVRRRA